MRIDALADRGAPNAIALIERDQRATYAELAAKSASVASRLLDEGIQPGDRVALYAPKSIALVAAMFGVWRAGGVAVPINPVLRSAQVAHILADSGAALLMSQSPRAQALADDDALGSTRAIDIDVAGADGGTATPATDRAPGDLAALLYTSGSTGRPKGVMLTHANLWLAADSVATYLGLAADDIALAILPLSFDAGLSVLTSALMAGGATVLFDYLVPRDVVSAVARHRVTTLPGVPPLFVPLVQTAWPEEARASLRRITVTGGRMPVPVTQRLRALFPQARLHLMYGLTEAFRSLSLDPALADTHPTSVGRAIPHARIGLFRADGTAVADDEPGELVHAGPLVAMGYWNDPALSAHRFRAAPALLGDGLAVWSGDTLRRDADALHYFVGRDDEMIKTSGLRVSPTDIEEAAHATGAVSEAAAFGVADDALGQAIALFAVAAGEGAADRLAHGLAAALPTYMRPARIEWRDALPRSANGKIDRAALRAELGA